MTSGQSSDMIHEQNSKCEEIRKDNEWVGGIIFVSFSEKVKGGEIEQCVNAMRNIALQRLAIGLLDVPEEEPLLDERIEDVLSSRLKLGYEDLDRKLIEKKAEIYKFELDAGERVSLSPSTMFLLDDFFKGTDQSMLVGKNTGSKSTFLSNSTVNFILNIL